MSYWVTIYDGDFGDGYNCKTCEDIITLSPNHFDDGEGYPEGCVAESLEKGQTPEQLLQELKEEKDARTQKKPDKASRDRYSLL